MMTYYLDVLVDRTNGIVRHNVTASSAEIVSLLIDCGMSDAAIVAYVQARLTVRTNTDADWSE